MSHYETLGVPKTASQSDIKKAYRKLSSQLHPDREGGDAERMSKVNAAYEVLGDPERRARYDQTGDSRAAPSIDDTARAAMVDVLSQLIESDGDIILMCRQSFQGAIEDADKAIKISNRAIEKYTKRRARVSVKSGDNIFTMLIDARINENRQKIVLADQQKVVGRRCLELLDEYVFHPSEDDERKTKQEEFAQLLIQTAARGRTDRKPLFF